MEPSVRSDKLHETWLSDVHYEVVKDRRCKNRCGIVLRQNLGIPCEFGYKANTRFEDSLDVLRAMVSVCRKERCLVVAKNYGSVARKLERWAFYCGSAEQATKLAWECEGH